MKLIQFRCQEDYGHDLYLTLFQVKRWCLIQSCFCTAVYARSWPYLNITMGYGKLFSFSFQVLWSGITIEIFSRSWFK